MRLLCLLAAAGAALAATTTPEQIHTSVAGRDANGESNGLAVSWFTQDATATSTVKYGLSKTAVNMTATGNAVQYLAGHGYHHHVVLPTLPLDSAIWYACGDAQGGFSPLTMARTSKSADTQLPLTMGVIGDFGFGKDGNALETMARLNLFNNAGRMQALLHVGDVSYADDAFLHYPTSFKYETVYNDYMNVMQNITESMPYQVMPGNHESECHSPACLLESKYRDSLNNFTAYNARFRMPAEESGAHGANMFYSFNYGPAHFIAIDTETDYDGAPEETHGDSGILPAGGFVPKGEQLKWLEADLAAANASRDARPFIVVMGHRPIYSLHQCSSTGVPTDYALVLQKMLEDLFHRYDVTLYLAGHVHAYSRTYPTYQNVPVKTYLHPGATTYSVVGAAGCDEMKNKQLAAQPVSKIPWAVYADDEHYGMGLLTFENKTTLSFTWYASGSGEVLDHFELTR